MAKKIGPVKMSETGHQLIMEECFPLAGISVHNAFMVTTAALK
jgi:hypothetical protein